MVSATSPRAAVAGAVLLAAGLVAPTGASAQRVEARLEPARVSAGETADLVVEVTGGELRMDVADPELPPLESVDVVTSSRASEVRLVGTEVTRRISFRYTLRPRALGALTIGPVRVRVEGIERRTRPLRLTVLDQADLGPPEEPEPDDPPAIFAVARVDRRSAWTGEQLTLTFAFYHDPRVPLGESPDYDPPETPGFWKVELDDQPAVAVERIGGRTYHVQRFRYALFPLREGELEIGPATVRIVEPDADRWWTPGRPRAIRTEPLTVSVRPLPDGAPRGFDGAVGRFRLAGSMERRRAQAGAPVELRLVVEGTGNPTAVPPPELPRWPEVSVDPPSVDATTELDGTTVGGRTTFRFLLTPRQPGSLDLGDARLAYFDPARGSYAVDSLDLGEIRIEPGPAVAARDADEGGPTLWEARAPAASGPRGWAGSGWYWLALAGPWAGWLLALGAGRLRELSASRSAGDRSAAARLAEARKDLEKGGETAAAAAAVQEAIGSRWGDESARADPAALRARLEARGVDPERIEVVVEARRATAAAAFGGGSPVVAAAAVERLEAVLREAAARPRSRAPGGSGRSTLAVLAGATLLAGGLSTVVGATELRSAAPGAADVEAAVAVQGVDPDGEAPAGTPPGVSPRERWEAANRAYREGDFAAAALAYRELSARWPDPLLEADRAAALWRAGERGSAVAAYLRALELAPRSWEVRADLAELRAELGDPPPADPGGAGPLEWIRLDEWLAALLAVSWLAFGTALIARRRRSARPAVIALLAGFVGIATLAAVDAAGSAGRRAVARSDAAIRSRPAGPPIATLPEGAVATVLERGGEAWRIRIEGLPAGWVASDRIVPLH